MSRNPAPFLEQALALHQAGRLKEAAPLYDRALALRPRDATLLGLAGALQSQLGKQALAVKLLQRALAERPDHAEARHNLGAALLKLERHAEAAEAFAAVTRALPDQPGAWLGLGQALRAQGQAEAAMAAFRRVLTLAPDQPVALAVLGMLLDEAGAAAESEPLLRRAVQRQPDQAAWHNSLGLVLQHLKQVEAAEIAYREALRLEPDSDAALCNFGNLLIQQRRGGEAARLLTAGAEARKAAHKPVSAELLGVLLDARAVTCDWRERAALLARIGAARIGPPHIIFHEDSPARLRQMLERLSAERRRPPLPMPMPRPAPADGRIRLGYLSNDLHEHATAYLIAEVLERHDRARFHVTAYSVGPDDGSPMRERLRAAVDVFAGVAALSDRELVERIAGDGVELLVDLKGWTEDSRLLALAWRPAPVQVTWLGYPGTLGADWVDYAIVDPTIAPPGAESHFTEQLVRLPDCYQPNDRHRRIGAPLDRAAAGLPAEGLVLACFCQAMKI
ncbi:MAG: tetratricopeptide repeat protein, partial [Roseococcus sp.]